MLTAKLARSFLGVLGVALLASACTTAGPRPEPEAPADPSTLLTLTVRNDQMDEAMVWLYVDTGDTEKVARLANGIFCLFLPSLVLFLSLPLLLRSGMDFYASLAASIALTVAAYFAMVYTLRLAGIEI